MKICKKPLNIEETSVYYNSKTTLNNGYLGSHNDIKLVTKTKAS